MMKTICLFAFSLFAAVASAQTPAPSPSPTGWTATAYFGTSSVMTRGERREYVTGRATLAGPVSGAIDAFVRADVTGTQDAGTLDFQNPNTFRALEVNGGLSHRLGLFDLGAIGGVTYSIEGQRGAPIQPRMYTGAGLVKARLRDGGYVGAGAGY